MSSVDEATRLRPCTVHLKLQDGLAEILTLEHADKRLGGILDSHGLVDLCVEAAVVDPLAHGLLMLGDIFGTHVGVADDETLPQQSFGHGQE